MTCSSIFHVKIKLELTFLMNIVYLMTMKINPQTKVVDLVIAKERNQAKQDHPQPLFAPLERFVAAVRLYASVAMTRRKGC
ncbi:hypothetical protein CLV24_12558 [Pontibacter ummariensis]|uniref:Uncharacterized protein n=1 Tax=Pontibacter ummariensis TaxID=1610492 RepID=A0A239K3T0_9BACT|nr:hypothetical protein CLV24_12558 [Pontibacter ummariensis]SNT12332.1 hypothetical protein SAMN06296052_12558 [Pontibacter ummariensis]